MQESRKRFWIVFTCVCLAIVVFCVVSIVATRLKTVTVEFRTRQDETVLAEGILDKVLDDGKFNYGKSVLFMDYEENIASIEKNNPYIKVEQIIRKFPNITRVYVSERVPVFRIRDKKNASLWYILDADFKVVDMVTDVKSNNYASTSYYAKTIEVSPESITLTSALGEFVNDEVDRNFLNNIVSGIKSRAQEVTIVKSVSIKKEQDYIFTITMKNSGINDDNGCEIVVVGQNNLKQKVFAGVSCFCENTENQATFDLSNKVITIEEVNGSLQGIMTNKTSEE